MGGAPSKQEFRTAILDLVNSSQVYYGQWKQYVTGFEKRGHLEQNKKI
jgi:hypothetical protein